MCYSEKEVITIEAGRENCGSSITKPTKNDEMKQERRRLGRM